MMARLGTKAKTERIGKEARLNHLVIKRAVKGSGLTEEKIAEVLGITDKHLRNLMKKDFNVSLELCHKIMLCFELSYHEVVVVYEETELFS